MYDDVNNKKNTLTNVVCVLGLVFDDKKLHARGSTTVKDVAANQKALHA